MSIYKLNELEAVLSRIKEKISGNSMKLLPVSAEKDVAELEGKYGICLPIAYRRFITDIADGMIIQDPNGYRYELLSFCDAEIDTERITRLFPLKNF